VNKNSDAAGALKRDDTHFKRMAQDFNNHITIINMAYMANNQKQK